MGMLLLPGLVLLAGIIVICVVSFVWGFLSAALAEVAQGVRRLLTHRR